MEPGKEYIVQLPGRDGLAYVRKREPVRPPIFPFSSNSALSQRSCSLDRAPQYVVTLPPPTPLIPLPLPLPLPVPIPLHPPPPPPPLQLDYLGAPQPGFTTFPAPPPPTSYRQIAPPPSRAEHLVQQHICSSCGKIRSPSFHIRHPITPGEAPRPGTCRKCVKKHTSSEESQDKAKRHRYSHRSRRERVYSDSAGNRRSSSSSKEEVHVVRRSHSASRDSARMRRSSLSSSNSKTEIVISYQPKELTVRRTTRRQSPPKEGVRIIRRIRYVDGAEQLRSRSRSRSSSRHSFSRYERREDNSYPEDDYVRIYTSTEEGKTRQHRIIEYSDDDNHIREHTRPASRRPTGSMLAQHGTPFTTHWDEDFDTSPGTYSRNSHSRRSMDESSLVYEPEIEELPRQSSRSVRILRVSQDDSRPTYGRGGSSGTADTAGARVSFAPEVSTRRAVRERHFIEEREPLQHEERRRPRMFDEDSSEEYLAREHLTPPRNYRYVRPSTPPDRHLAAAPHYSDHETTRIIHTTQTSPHRAEFSPPRGRPPIRRSPSRARSISYSPPFYRHLTVREPEHESASYLPSRERSVNFAEEPREVLRISRENSRERFPARYVPMRDRRVDYAEEETGVLRRSRSQSRERLPTRRVSVSERRMEHAEEPGEVLRISRSRERERERERGPVRYVSARERRGVPLREEPEEVLRVSRSREREDW